MTETLSNSEVPKTKSALLDKYEEEKVNEKEPLNPENIKSQTEELPEPTGWRLLILPFTPPERTKGGLIISRNFGQRTYINKRWLCFKNGSIGLSR